jgi:hypothetical protein
MGLNCILRPSRLLNCRVELNDKVRDTGNSGRKSYFLLRKTSKREEAELSETINSDTFGLGCLFLVGTMAFAFSNEHFKNFAKNHRRFAARADSHILPRASERVVLQQRNDVLLKFEHPSGFRRTIVSPSSQPGSQRPKPSTTSYRKADAYASI